MGSWLTAGILQSMWNVPWRSKWEQCSSELNSIAGSAVKRYNVGTFYAFALYWLIKKHLSCLKIMYFYRILLWKFTSIRSRPFLCTVKQTSRNKYDFRFICRPEIWTQLKCFEEPRLLEKNNVLILPLFAISSIFSVWGLSSCFKGSAIDWRS